MISYVTVYYFLLYVLYESLRKFTKFYSPIKQFKLTIYKLSFELIEVNCWIVWILVCFINLNQYKIGQKVKQLKLEM